MTRNIEIRTRLRVMGEGEFKVIRAKLPF